MYLLNGLGIEHGVNLELLIDASAYISEALGRPNGSRVASAILAIRQAALQQREPAPA